MGPRRPSRLSSPTSWSSTPQIDLEVSGFEIGEIDGLLDRDGLDQEDDLPEVENGTMPVSRLGDLWVLGDHRLLCGDALRAESYARVMGDDKAEMMFADPPYNVPVEGHVSGLGAVKHANFAMASGELVLGRVPILPEDRAWPCGEPVRSTAPSITSAWTGDTSGSCMAAGDEVYSELKNLCVWNKTNAGMGSLYRSKHELIFVFKVGKSAAHQQCRAREVGTAPDQCLGLCRPECLERDRRASLPCTRPSSRWP